MFILMLNRKKYMRRKQHPFTLIELLVVVSIISILATMLLPALGKAKAKANRIACASTLKGVGTAIFMYTSDNRGYMPYRFVPGTDTPSNTYAPLVAVSEMIVGIQWKPGISQSEKKQISEAFRCPDNDSDLPIHWGASGSYQPNGQIQSFKTRGGTRGGTPKFWRMSEFVKPSECIYLSEGVSTVTDPLHLIYSLYNSATYPDQEDIDYKRHNSVNVLYMDSHVNFSKMLPDCTDLGAWTPDAR